MKESIQQNTLANNRLSWADIAKGIAIVLIYFGHTVYTPSLLKMYLSTFHVAIFFFIAGYFFSLKYDFKTFLTNKIKRLIVPLVFFGILSTLLVNIVLFVLYKTPFDFKAIFLYPFIQMPYESGSEDVGWFIACLFTALLLFRGIAKLCRNKKVIIIAVSFILSGCAFLFYKYTAIVLPWQIISAFEALPVLSVGYILRKSKIENIIFKPYFIPAYLVGLLVFGYINLKINGDDFYVVVHVSQIGNFFLYYLTAFCGIFSVIGISKLIASNKVLEFLGQNSLIFYLIECAQYFINFMLKELFMFIPDDKWYINLLASSLAITVAFVILSLVCMFINKYIPFLVGRDRIKKKKF